MTHEMQTEDGVITTVRGTVIPRKQCDGDKGLLGGVIGA